MPHRTVDPAPPLTIMPEIFNRIPITTETEVEINKACQLVQSDPSIDVPLQNHIIKSILHMRGLPNALHLARSIIGIHKASDSGSLQAFVEMFVAGIKFLRIADEHSPLYADEDDKSDDNNKNDGDDSSDDFSDSNGFGDSDSYSDSNSYGNSDGYVNSDGYGDSDGYGNDNGYGNTNGYVNSDCYGNINYYGNSNHYCDSDGDGDGENSSEGNGLQESFGIYHLC